MASGRCPAAAAAVPRRRMHAHSCPAWAGALTRRSALPRAAALCSPPTAVRLLDEFVHLAEGDTLVQNGATSAVGRVRRAGAQAGRQVAAPLDTVRQALAVRGLWRRGSFPALPCCPCGPSRLLWQLVIQLAKSRGINTVNIIRDRPDRHAVLAGCRGPKGCWEDAGCRLLTTGPGEGPKQLQLRCARPCSTPLLPRPRLCAARRWHGSCASWAPPW